MSKGINKFTIIGDKGFVALAEGNWDFLYEVSTIKHPDFNVGDRVALPDGRVFRYATAGALGVVPELGAVQSRISNTNAVAPAQATAASLNSTFAAGVVGSRYVSLTIAATFGHLATGVLTKDELRGGYIVIGNGTSQHPQMRGIIGHPVLAAAGILTVELDAPLVTAVTVGTTNIEAFMNPYTDLNNTGLGDGLTEFASVMGVPVMAATVGQYVWVQTWGPCWLTSAGNTCNDSTDRTLWFQKSGIVVSGADITVDNGYQLAGFAIDGSSSGQSNAPLVNLQINP
jgi:hypothetical protein